MAQTHGSPTRPSRPLDGPLLHVDTGALATRLRSEPSFATDGRNSETVVADGPTRVIVTVVDAGRDIGGEHNDGHVAILVLEGDGELVRGEARARVSAGALVVVAPGSAWSLRAEVPSTFVASFWQPAP